MTVIRLVAFDLDGTLVRGDTVCEVIARRLGHLDHMRVLETEATDAASLIRVRSELARYYRGRSVSELGACRDDLAPAPGIREAFDLLAKHGIHTAIVTLTWAFAARWLASRLGLDAGAVAVVGDSWRDLEMFAVASHRFFVGSTLVPGLDARHHPDGDLGAIAHAIVSASSFDRHGRSSP